MSSFIRPLIFWEGFPPCGLITKKVVAHYGDNLRLLGTRASVPFEGLELLLGRQIDWLDTPNQIWDRREEFADRNLVIHTGWGHPGWLKFDRWIKNRGAKVVVVVDNSWKGTLRQYLGAVWFRLWLKRHFDAALVPGRSSSRLMRFLGMPQSQIFTGAYGAYEAIYQAGPQLANRRKEFLFVGQLITRKGIDVLVDAYRLYRSQGGCWDLRIVGSGPLANVCKGDGLIYEGFSQALDTAKLLGEAACLVLPSREDHWGTVVCEAMACGTPVIASRWVGAAEDLIRSGINGWIFDRLSPETLASCMHKVSGWTSRDFDNAQKTSLGIALGYQSSSYAAAHSAIVDTIFKCKCRE